MVLMLDASKHIESKLIFNIEIFSSSLMQIYIVLYITISKTIISHNNFHKIYMRILFQTLSPAHDRPSTAKIKATTRIPLTESVNNRCKNNLIERYELRLAGVSSKELLFRHISIFDNLTNCCQHDRYLSVSRRPPLYRTRLPPNNTFK